MPPHQAGGMPWPSSRIVNDSACLSPYQVTHLPIYQLRLLALRFVRVRPFDILCDCNWIVRHAVLVDAVVVRIAHLLVAGAVAFDRAFVDVGIGGRWRLRHCGLLANGIVEVAAIIVG